MIRRRWLWAFLLHTLAFAAGTAAALAAIRWHPRGLQTVAEVAYYGVLPHVGRSTANLVSMVATGAVGYVPTLLALLTVRATVRRVRGRGPSSLDPQTEAEEVGRLRRVARAVSRTVTGIVLFPVRVVQRVVGAIRRGLARIRYALIGEGAGEVMTRMVIVAIAALFGVSTVGLLFALESQQSVQGSSAPIITFVLEVVTSGPFIVAIVVIYLRGYLFLLGRRNTSRAARITGFPRRVIQRLATEAKTTAGTRRVVAFADDEVSLIAGNVLEALRDPDYEDVVRMQTAEDIGELNTAVDGLDPDDDLPDTVDDPDVEPGASVGEPTDEEDEPLKWPEKRKLAELDLSTGFNVDRFIWRFCLPAGLVFLAEVMVSGLWLVWWLYIVFAGFAVAVGATVHTLSRWWVNRKVKNLRKEYDGESYTQLSILVKTVETDDITVGLAFVGRRSYAHTDFEQLAETVAERAHQMANGYQPAPAIEERYAWALRKRIPSFAKYRQVAKNQILEELITTVHRSDQDIIPKEILIHQVIETGRRYTWRGLRFVGYGYDPELVREVYCELVPAALVEEPVHVEGPNGEQREIVGVRTRPQTMHRNIAQLRAGFAQEFRAREFGTRYDLPEPEIDEEPEWFAVTETPDGIEYELQPALPEGTPAAGD